VIIFALFAVTHEMNFREVQVEMTYHKEMAKLGLPSEGQIRDKCQDVLPPLT